jgi:hypothetical protein
MSEVSRPASEVVQDMGSVNDCALSNFCLVLEPGEELGTAQNIEINSDFVKKQNSPGPQEAHCKLNTTALTVRNSVHAPVGVDIEHGYELISTIGVRITADRAKQLVDANVSSDNRVENPFKTEISDSLETFLERVNSTDRDGITGCKALASEETKQSRLTSTVGTNKQSTRSRRKVESDIVDTS